MSLHTEHQHPSVDTDLASERTSGVSEPTPEPGAQPDRKSHKKLVYGVGGSVAGAAVIAASILGISAANNEPPAKPEQTSSAPADPGDTVAPPSSIAEVLPTIDVHEFDMPADSSPEQLATAFAKLESAQIGGPLTQAVYEHQYDVLDAPDIAGLTGKQYGEKVAAAWLTPLFDAQYASGWQGDANLSQYFDHEVDNLGINIASLRDKQTLTDSVSLDFVDAISGRAGDDRLVLDIHIIEHYHGNNHNDATVDGSKGHEVVTFQKQGDRYVVANVQLQQQ